MGDYIPVEELDKFLAKCNDAAAQKATKEAAEKAKIQADNVGHKLLSKMGWKEGAYLPHFICKLVPLLLSVSCASMETRSLENWRSGLQVRV